ncbi:MAG: acyltransferase [Desulfobacterales bacterium]|nr:acyltransferase [Desulfobacterales bacterium]
MNRKLMSPFIGSLNLTICFFNTIFFSLLIFIVAIAKALIPFTIWRKLCNLISNTFAESWIWVNNFAHDILCTTRWDIQGVENLEKHEWYLVLANHQSWTDIIVLQRVFNRKIPFLKFFIKKELFWFPILGQAWWALDFPFIRRYTKSELKRKPHLKGKDMEITRKACEKFKTVPISIMNFVEGTRFTQEKHKRQRSPYANLLRAKAGGIAFVLGAMGGKIRRVLDVTIFYPENPKTFWAYLCGDISEIKVRVKSLPVHEDLVGNYLNDQNFRIRFQTWLNQLWTEKDQSISEMMISQPSEL